GNRTRVTVKKNKVAPPFKVAEFDIMYNEGISTTGDLIDLGVEYDILSKRGAYFRYNDELIGQGRESSKDYLREHAGLAREIDNLIRQKAGLPARAPWEEGNGAAAASADLAADPLAEARAPAPRLKSR
ncbi:MAG: DNA recombination/repair protein RecA, partial [Caldilineaceae bacterium]|nr:DNA recombination/repair protein RecA [Caldilineaceae bacterium]